MERATRHWSKLILTVVVAPVFALLLGQEAGAQSSAEYEVKAVFLFRFAQFVKWPPKAFAEANSPLTIGILGDDPFGGALERAVSGESVGGRKLVIRHSRHVEELKGCQVVFVSKSERGRTGEIIGSLRGSNVLTVGEMESFTAQGGMINFTMQSSKAGSEVGFEVNAGAAQRAGLEISSRLLKLGRVISG